MGVGMVHVGDARAEQYPNRLFSIRALESDAIVFATVKTLRGNAEHPELVDMEFEDVAVVRSRWDLRSSPLTAIRVRGNLSVDDGDVLRVHLGHTGSMRQGSRYVMMLRGGEWDGPGPFTPGGRSLFEIRPDGYVGCDSGWLYAINQLAYACGKPENMVGEPYRESTLSADFRKLLIQAMRIRPELERQISSSVRPLSLMPRSSQP